MPSEVFLGMTRSLLFLPLLVLVGCQYGEVVVSTCPGGCEKERYLDECRAWALDKTLENAYIRDTQVSLQKRESKYEIVYVDADYLSYRLYEWEYVGGVESSPVISAGTLSRVDAHKLALSDFFDAEALAAIRPTDDFYYASGAIHLFYGEEEIVVNLPLRKTR